MNKKLQENTNFLSQFCSIPLPGMMPPPPIPPPIPPTVTYRPQPVMPILGWPYSLPDGRRPPGPPPGYPPHVEEPLKRSKKEGKRKEEIIRENFEDDDSDDEGNLENVKHSPTVSKIYKQCQDFIP